MESRQQCARELYRVVPHDDVERETTRTLKETLSTTPGEGVKKYDAVSYPNRRTKRAPVGSKRTLSVVTRTYCRRNTETESSGVDEPVFSGKGRKEEAANAPKVSRRRRRLRKTRTVESVVCTTAFVIPRIVWSAREINTRVFARKSARILSESVFIIRDGYPTTLAPFPRYHSAKNRAMTT